MKGVPMSNVKRVLIKGWVPYNGGEPPDAQKEVIEWLGVMNLPSYGLRITYGKSGGIPVPATGGVLSMSEFKVSGEEGISWTRLDKMVGDFVKAGVIVLEARAMDTEFDPDNMAWSSLPIPKHEQPAIGPDPMAAMIVKAAGG